MRRAPAGGPLRVRACVRNVCIKALSDVVRTDVSILYLYKHDSILEFEHLWEASVNGTRKIWGYDGPGPRCTRGP